MPEVKPTRYCVFYMVFDTVKANKQIVLFNNTLHVREMYRALDGTYGDLLSGGTAYIKEDYSIELESIRNCPFSPNRQVDEILLRNFLCIPDHRDTTKVLDYFVYIMESYTDKPIERIVIVQPGDIVEDTARQLNVWHRVVSAGTVTIRNNIVSNIIGIEGCKFAPRNSDVRLLNQYF